MGKTFSVAPDYVTGTLIPGQTIVKCQSKISQHCWALDVACVWLRSCACWVFQDSIIFEAHVQQGDCEYSEFKFI